MSQHCQAPLRLRPDSQAHNAHSFLWLKAGGPWATSTALPRGCGRRPVRPASTDRPKVHETDREHVADNPCKVLSGMCIPRDFTFAVKSFRSRKMPSDLAAKQAVLRQAQSLFPPYRSSVLTKPCIGSEDLRTFRKSLQHGMPCFQGCIWPATTTIWCSACQIVASYPENTTYDRTNSGPGGSITLGSSVMLIPDM